MKMILRMMPVLALLSFPAAAARAADDNAFRFFEEEAVVITSAKRAQPVTKAAANASVITAEDIKLYGYRTLGEALQSVPGFYVTDDRNYSYQWVRGFGRPGDYNSRVLLLINGHRMNDNIYGEAFVGQEFSLDMQSVSRIEVIKGPGAALYGDNALLAVINVITKTAAQGTGATVTAEAGSYGTYKEFADFSHKSGNGFNIYASGSDRSMQGQSLYFPEFSSINNGNTDKSADAEKNKTFFLDMSMNGWRLQGNTNVRTKAIPTASYGNTFNDPRSKTTDSRSFIELSKSVDLRENLSLFARIYSDWYYYRGFYMFDNATPPPAESSDHDNATSSWYGEESRLKYDFGGENILILGQEYEKNTVGLQQDYTSDPYSDNLNVNAVPYRWAIFAQQELRPLDSLRLTLGGRYDRYQDFGNTLNPRIAAVYDLSGKTTFKFMAGSAFKAPEPYEMLYSYPGQSEADPGLRPEKIRTYEAYCERQLPGQWGYASVGYFINDITDLIDETVDPSNGLTQFINKDHVKTRGLELNAKLRASSRISGHVGYTLQDTRYAGGGSLSNSPEQTATVGIVGKLPDMGASAGMELFVIGPRTTFQGTRLASAALLSLNLSVELWKAGPRCYLGIYNLTNANYQASGAAEHVQAALAQNGRNYTIGLEYKF